MNAYIECSMCDAVATVFLPRTGAPFCVHCLRLKVADKLEAEGGDRSRVDDEEWADYVLLRSGRFEGRQMDQQGYAYLQRLTVKLFESVPLTTIDFMRSERMLLLALGDAEELG